MITRKSNKKNHKNLMKEVNIEVCIQSNKTLIAIELINRLNKIGSILPT